MPQLVTNPAIQLPQAELYYFPNFVAVSTADNWLQQLLTEIRWTSRQIKLYGRTMLMPRKLAWYADPGIDYEYSGGKSPREDWTQTLLIIKQAVEDYSKQQFNGVLLNWYRNGQDSMGWHSDAESSLGRNPTIASVSLGAERVLQLRHKFNKSIPNYQLKLAHGSLLLMTGTTQQYWQHQLPKTQRKLDSRVNLTWRKIRIDN